MAHGVEYAVGGFALFGALNDGRTRRAVVYAVLVCAAYGVLDEFHQGFVPGRDSSIGDVVADSVGAGLGTLLAAAWATRRLRRGR
jgi:VanZ family protein